MIGLDKLVKFCKSRRGAMSVTFALTSVPMLIGVGAAVDFRNVEIARTELQDALDAALLATARTYSFATGVSETERRQRSESDGRAIFQQNLAGARVAADPSDLTFEYNPEAVTVRANVTGRAEVLFASLLGVEELELSAAATAQGADQRRVEVVLALDNTGSMAEANRMVLMRAAAQNFVDFLFDNGQPDRIYVSVVPWAHTVNVSLPTPAAAHDPSPYAETFTGLEGEPIAQWPQPSEDTVNDYMLLPELYRRYSLRGGLRVNGPTPSFANPPALTAEDESLSAKSNRQLFEESFNGFGWRGCIRSAFRERLVNNNRVVTQTLSDAPPAPSAQHAPVTPLFQPYVLETDVDVSGVTTTNSSDPQLACPAPMLGLSANRRQVKQALERMRPQGNTYQDVGLMWAWRALSDEDAWVNLFGHTGLNRPAPNDPEQVRKVIVLLTDGQNASNPDFEQYYGCTSNGNDANRRGSGSSTAGNCWRADGVQRIDNTVLNNLTSDACRAIREDARIELYTIAVDVTDTGAINLLDRCAGGPGSPRFENISAAQIETVLLTIAESTLRLVE